MDGMPVLQLTVQDTTTINTAKDKDLLQKVQRRLTRMIQGLKQMVYNKRFKRVDLIEVYKMSRSLSSVDFSKFFALDKSSRTRGHIWQLKK